MTISCTQIHTRVRAFILHRTLYYQEIEEANRIESRNDLNGKNVSRNFSFFFSIFPRNRFFQSNQKAIIDIAKKER
jgi:hypothetical protein